MFASCALVQAAMPSGLCQDSCEGREPQSLKVSHLKTENAFNNHGMRLLRRISLTRRSLGGIPTLAHFVGKCPSGDRAVAQSQYPGTAKSLRHPKPKKPHYSAIFPLSCAEPDVLSSLCYAQANPSRLAVFQESISSLEFPHCIFRAYL
jgi:hypothetical protein